MSAKQYHCYFSGKVQGVFFRKTTLNYAADLGLKGWVQNLEDGRVEMVAEGPEYHLDLLIAQLEADFEISEIEKQVNDPEESFADFRIEY